MADEQDQINLLLQKLEKLQQKQELFAKEINQLRKEIYQLKIVEGSGKTASTFESHQPKPTIKPGELIEEYNPVIPRPPSEKPLSKFLPSFEIPSTIKADWEKFIGENLISKIGIFILVLGVGIGAKFSIDNNLISPLARIIAGYLVGLSLLGFGIKLKQNYSKYSAVLVSGALAILYFITYFAYSFYGLMPQLVAFGLMVIFTAFTVVAALNYNQQVIALFGLVGAYGVPFLLGDDSGNILTLFAYITVLNIGILVIAFKKYWKGVHRAAFILTWLIFALWFFGDYQESQHFTLALTFASIFFTIFYVLFLAYKLLRNEQFNRRDIWLVLTNSFLFYGFGYGILMKHEVGSQFLGLFTLANAVVHFGVSTIVHKNKQADKNLFYLIIGFVLVFLTLAIPVQLDGNWVTLIWALEAALLFWIGRTKGAPFYEKIAYPLMLLACFSLMEDWSNYNSYSVANRETYIKPIFNIHFLTSLLFIGAFTFINLISQNTKYAPASFKRPFIQNILKIAIPAILIMVIYASISLEINNYFSQSYKDSVINFSNNPNRGNTDLPHFNTIWQINFMILFLSLLVYINAKWIQNNKLAKLNLLLNAFAVLLFLAVGLFSFRELQRSYISQDLAEYFNIGYYNITIRYISLAFFGCLLYVSFRYLRKVIDNATWNLTIAAELGILFLLLILLSSELIYWMEMVESTQSNKLGLSILWGVYSLLLIVLGIWKRKKHIRIAAIGLFGLTLIKLFFYDLANLNTISKTIVLVSLGLLLLIISFLYNKYKHLIANE